MLSACRGNVKHVYMRSLVIRVGVGQYVKTSVMVEQRAGKEKTNRG